MYTYMIKLNSKEYRVIIIIFEVNNLRSRYKYITAIIFFCTEFIKGIK